MLDILEEEEKQRKMICVILSKLFREIEREREEKTNISGKCCRCPKRNETQSQRKIPVKNQD